MRAFLDELKAAVTGTDLSVELWHDPACTVAAGSATVAHPLATPEPGRAEQDEPGLRGGVRGEHVGGARWYTRRAP